MEIPLTISSNAKEFAKNLNLYCSVSSRGFSAALANQGEKFSVELFRQFHQIHPRPGSIFDSAAMRGYKVRRKENTFLVPTEAGLSQRAIERAKELLGGQKSDLFRPLNNGLVPVRFGARGGHRALRGGRTGWRFSKSALHAYQLTPSQLKAAMPDAKDIYSAVRLNLRALATYLELRYRSRGAQGGIMAVQWLNKTYKWSSKGTYKTTQLVQRAANGAVVGTVSFETVAGELSAIVFKGFVPGTPEEAQKHGILDKVFMARANDLLLAIANSHAKVASRFK